jgi:hypothetical protein
MDLGICTGPPGVRETRLRLVLPTLDDDEALDPMAREEGYSRTLLEARVREDQDALRSDDREDEDERGVNAEAEAGAEEG